MASRNPGYRAKDAKGTSFLHTLNGSGVAVGRALIAVLDTHQRADGTIAIPEVLRPYMGGMAWLGGGWFGGPLALCIMHGTPEMHVASFQPERV